MRNAMLLLTLLGALLAGCTEDAEPERQAPDDVALVTDPDDFSHVNATDGSGWHMHDYWKGEQEILLLDAQGGVGSSSCTGCDDGMAVGAFRPEPQHIVPQGAAWVNVTVAVEERGGQNAGYELWVKTAADSEPRRIDAVADGQTVSVASTNERNDPPHHVLSLWRFEVRVLPVGDEASFEGSVSVRAMAVRGLEIEPYPPHPDLWQGKDELPLLAFQEDTPGLHTQTDTSSSCYFTCLWSFAPGDGAVVPYDAAAVRVVLRQEPGVPTVGLLYHGADTWEMRPAHERSQDGLTTTWTILLSETRGDSPYARQSLWEFRLFNEQPTPVRAWAGAYSVEATVLRTL